LESSCHKPTVETGMNSRHLTGKLSGFLIFNFFNFFIFILGILYAEKRLSLRFIRSFLHGCHFWIITFRYR
jgi:hypothetical protein